MQMVKEAVKKIQTRKAKIGIIGMGYVGAALADLVTEKRFETTGFVTRQERADRINERKTTHLRATTNPSDLKKQDVILICVQTPVDESKLPDLRFLTAASEQVANNLHPGQLVIVESSIATGTTRNVVLPILMKSGLKPDVDFFLAFSPERVDPGNKDVALGQIPKVVAGLDTNSHILVKTFYEQIMEKVVPVSSLETAEMVKLFENTFRLINISLVNELAAYAKTWDIDMWEIVNAAATKPFGFMPHYPSPGIGGHCIPVDPFYLLDDAKKRGVNLELIEASGRINDAQPKKVVERTFEILERRPIQTTFGTDTYSELPHALMGLKGGKSTSRSKPKILLLGLTYKPDVDDVRESPALKIWDLFLAEGCEVSYHDPLIPQYREAESKPLTHETLAAHDMIVLVTNHSSIDYDLLAKAGKKILDTRHVFANENKPSHIYGL